MILILNDLYSSSFFRLRWSLWCYHQFALSISTSFSFSASSSSSVSLLCVCFGNSRCYNRITIFCRVIHDHNGDHDDFEYNNCVQHFCCYCLCARSPFPSISLYQMKCNDRFRGVSGGGGLCIHDSIQLNGMIGKQLLFVKLFACSFIYSPFIHTHTKANSTQQWWLQRRKKIKN